VRLKPIIICVTLIMFSIPGYIYSSHMVSDFMGSMIGHQDPTMAYSILQQLGIPPIPVIDQIIHFSFVGIAVAGIIFGIFGVLLKKKLPKQILNISLEEPSTSAKKTQEDSSQKSVHILKERLAKGEITPDDFLNLRKFLD